LEYKVDAQSVFYSEGIDLEHNLMGEKLYIRSTSVLRRLEDVMNQSALLGVGVVVGVGEELREKESRVLRVESECSMMKGALEGNMMVKGMLIGIERLNDGRTRYEMYVRGEGTKSVRVRENGKEKRKYRMYEMRRYVDEKKGGMKLRMEFM
jgi:hypothetical protein